MRLTSNLGFHGWLVYVVEPADPFYGDGKLFTTTNAGDADLHMEVTNDDPNTRTVTLSGGCEPGDAYLCLDMVAHVYTIPSADYGEDAPPIADIDTINWNEWGDTAIQSMPFELCFTTGQASAHANDRGGFDKLDCLTVTANGSPFAESGGPAPYIGTPGTLAFATGALDVDGIFAHMESEIDVLHFGEIDVSPFTLDNLSISPGCPITTTVEVTNNGPTKAHLMPRLKITDTSSDTLVYQDTTATISALAAPEDIHVVVTSDIVGDDDFFVLPIYVDSNGRPAQTVQVDIPEDAAAGWDSGPLGLSVLDLIDISTMPGGTQNVEGVVQVRSVTSDTLLGYLTYNGDFIPPYTDGDDLGSWLAPSETVTVTFVDPWTAPNGSYEFRVIGETLAVEVGNGCNPTPTPTPTPMPTPTPVPTLIITPTPTPTPSPTPHYEVTLGATSASIDMSNSWVKWNVISISEFQAPFVPLNLTGMQAQMMVGSLSSGGSHDIYLTAESISVLPSLIYLNKDLLFGIGLFGWLVCVVEPADPFCGDGKLFTTTDAGDADLHTEVTDDDPNTRTVTLSGGCEPGDAYLCLDMVAHVYTIPSDGFLKDAPPIADIDTINWNEWGDTAIQSMPFELCFTTGQASAHANNPSGSNNLDCLTVTANGSPFAESGGPAPYIGTPGTLAFATGALNVDGLIGPVYGEVDMLTYGSIEFDPSELDNLQISPASPIAGNTVTTTVEVTNNGPTKAHLMPRLRITDTSSDTLVYQDTTVTISALAAPEDIHVVVTTSMAGGNDDFFVLPIYVDSSGRPAQTVQVDIPENAAAGWDSGPLGLSVLDLTDICNAAGKPPYTSGVVEVRSVTSDTLLGYLTYNGDFVPPYTDGDDLGTWLAPGETATVTFVDPWTAADGCYEFRVIGETLEIDVGSICNPTPTPIPTPTPEPNKIFFSQNPYNMFNNQSFNVKVLISNVTSLWAGQFDIEYNPNIIQITGVSDGLINGETVHADGNWALVGSGPGGQGVLRFIIDLLGTDGVTGSGYICDINFDVAPSTCGISDLDFAGTLELWNYEINPIYGPWIDSSVTVACEPTPIPIPTPTPMPTPTPVATLMPTLTPTPTPMQTPTPVPTLMITPTPSPTPEPTPTPMPTPTHTPNVGVKIDNPDYVMENSDCTIPITVIPLLSEVEHLANGIFDLTYDPALFEVTGVTDGLIGGTVVPIDQWELIPPGEQGTVRVIVRVPEIEGASGEGSLAEVHFHVLGSAGDQANMILSNVELTNVITQRITTLIINTTVRIIAGSGGGGGGGGGSKSSLYPQLDVELGNGVSSWEVNYFGTLLEEVNIDSPSDAVSVHIPRFSKALASDGNRLSEISITPIDPPPAAPDGYHLIAAYSFTPDGATFNPQMEITVSYDPTTIPDGAEECDLIVACIGGAEGCEFVTGVVDTETNTVTFTVGHFSVYAIMAAAPEPTPEPPAPAPAPIDTSGLSTGAWAGIGTAILVILLAIGAGAWFMLRQRRMVGQEIAAADEWPQDIQ